MKKFKLFALTALLALGTNAFAATYKTRVEGSIQYQYDKDESGKDGTAAKPYSATVVGVKAATDPTELTIPATVSFTNDDGDAINLVVTAFASNWDQASGLNNVSAKLKTLTINIDNIATDLTNAFTNLTVLESLTIIDNSKTPTITTMGAIKVSTGVKASLKTLDLSKFKGYPSVGDDVFAGATYAKLESIKLPATITSIGARAFQGSNIKSIVISNKITSIGANAFENAKSLATVDLSGAAALKTIGASAFKGTALTSVDFSACAKLEEIGALAYEGLEFTSISIPSTVKSIGNLAFKGSKITSIAIPDKVTSIGTAFSGIATLETITGMKGLISLDADAFKGDEKLTAIDLSANEVLTSLGTAFGGCKAIETIKFPKTLTTLPAGLLTDCVALVTFEAPGVTTINTAFPAKAANNLSKTLETLVLGDLAADVIGFEEYTALKTVTIGSVTSGADIKTGAFKNCTALTTFTMNKGGKIQSNAFEGCTALTTFTMTDGSVLDNAFYGCTALTAFNLLDPQAPTTNYIADKAFLGCTPWITITTTATYMAAQLTAPKNAKYATSESSIIKTVADKGTSGKFFGKFENNDPSGRKAIFEVTAGVKLYSVYVDGDNAIFSALRTFESNKKYYVPAGAHVIIKSDAAVEVPYTFDNTVDNSIAYDDIYSKNHESKATNWAAPAAANVASLAAFQANYVGAGKYVYALTNGTNGGFGFTFYAGTKISDTGFYVITTKRPAEAGARLNTIWLDENGNPEGEATAIESVKNIADDGVIYNMAGQKVDANYKGIVIKNGKKVILK